jgi:hypothetical protein
LSLAVPLAASAGRLIGCGKSGATRVEHRARTAGKGVRGNSAHYTQAIGDRSDAPRRRLAELAITC